MSTLLPTLRDLTEAIQRRAGVRSVVILGADGLVIETHDPGHQHGSQNAEALAARVPAVAMATRQLGQTAGSGDLVLAVLELEQGYGIIMQLTAHAMLFVSAGPEVALGELLFDLRRHRAPMAALVEPA